MKMPNGKNFMVLKTDDDIREAFADSSVKVFYREGGTGRFEQLPSNDIEDVIDATTYGFEFIASTDVEAETKHISELDYVSVYDYEPEDLQR